MKKLFAFLLITMLLLPFAAMAESVTVEDVQINVYTDAATGERIVFLPAFANADKVTGDFTVMQSKNIPALFITTVTGSMDKVHADKSEKESALIKLIDEDGEVLIDTKLNYIKGHGNSTYRADKKSYQIKFEEKTNVLSMGKAKKWLLMANAQDGSFMRNKLVYDALNTLGVPYAVDAEYADLYLNGDYAGNYIITEKIEVGGKRIDIAIDESDPPFLIEIDNNPEEGDVTFETEWGYVVRVHNPEVPTDAQLQLITEKTRTLEKTLADQGDFLPLIDLNSFARSAAINEITKNNDAFDGSRFFYLTKENNWLFNADIYWDYDSTLGNWNYQNGLYKSPDGLLLPDLSMWYETMYHSDVFFAALQQQYALARPVFESYVTEGIDKMLSKIEASAAMDYARYKGEYTFTKLDTTKEQAAALKTFLTNRLAFLDSAITQKKEYVKLLLILDGVSGEEATRFVWLEKGSPISALPLIENTEGIAAQWMYDGSTDILAPDEALNESTMLMAVFEK